MRLFVSASDGNLYSHLINIPELIQDDDLLLVENICIPLESRSPLNKPISNIFFSAYSQLMFTSFEDGFTFCGKLIEKEMEIINALKLKPFDSKDKLNYPSLFQKQGQILLNVKDISVSNEKYRILAMYKKGNEVFPVLIEMTKDKIFYQPLLNPMTKIKSEGYCILEAEDKENIVCYIVVTYEDGSICIFTVEKDFNERQNYDGFKINDKKNNKKNPNFEFEKINSFF